MKTIAEIKAWLEQQEELSPSDLQSLSQDSRKGVQQLLARYQRQQEKRRQEQERLQKMWAYEQACREQGYRWIAGVDEAGRGPLAGPVVAAAVILPLDFPVEQLNDSKQLSDATRQLLRQRIEEQAISVGIGMVHAEEIDRINILQATYQAMRLAVQHGQVTPDHLLLDAVEIPNLAIPQTAIIKGDTLSHSIAAASIIAKTTRDEWMRQQAEQYPQYGFDRHMGYATPEHLARLQKYGPSPLHRRSFAPVRNCLYTQTEQSSV
jgi:ribonuclease HII